MEIEMEFFDHMTDLIVLINVKTSGIIYKNHCAADVLLSAHEEKLLINALKKDKNKGQSVAEIDKVVYELQFKENANDANIWIVRGIKAVQYKIENKMK